METIEDEERKQAEALKILKPSEKQKTNSSEDIFPKHQGSHEIKKEIKKVEEQIDRKYLISNNLK